MVALRKRQAETDVLGIASISLNAAAWLELRALVSDDADMDASAGRRLSETRWCGGLAKPFSDELRVRGSTDL